MIRPIVHDPILLARKSAPATVLDTPTIQDLRDTLTANQVQCVGMAANMIGVTRRIIIFDGGAGQRVMCNPEITAATGAYQTQEGCLSLSGVRPCRRFRSITVKYQDEGFQWQTETFSGFTAQIIQHEIDHCNGILI